MDLTGCVKAYVGKSRRQEVESNIDKYDMGDLGGIKLAIKELNEERANIVRQILEARPDLTNAQSNVASIENERSNVNPNVTSIENNHSGRKTEYIDWFVNYTNQEGTGRTTETKQFKTRVEAKAFAEGKYGYITRKSDGASDFNTDKGNTSFVEYFGGFSPSAQEEQNILSITGEKAPAVVSEKKPYAGKQAVVKNPLTTEAEKIEPTKAEKSIKETPPTNTPEVDRSGAGAIPHETEFKSPWGVETTIYKNPTAADYQTMRMRFKEEFPNAPSGSPAVRSTIDTEGNRYSWYSSDFMHEPVESFLKEKYGIDTNQNNDERQIQFSIAPTISQTISPSTKSELEGATNAYQLLSLAIKHGNPVTSGLAKLLRSTIPDSKLLATPVSFANVAHSSYSTEKGITLAEKDVNTLAFSTVLHEIIHAITVKEMRSNPILRMRVKAMMKEVAKQVDPKLLKLAHESEGSSKKFLSLANDFTDEEKATAYALSSPEEFLSQAFSSKSFQELLKSIPATSTDSTIKTLWDRLVALIGKALGITDRNMLSDVISVTVQIGQHEVSVDYGKGAERLSVDKSKKPLFPIRGGEAASISGTNIETISAFLAPVGSMEMRLGKEKIVKSEGNIDYVTGQFGSWRILYKDKNGNYGGVIQGVRDSQGNIISNIYVTPSLRNQGVARALIEAVKKSKKNVTLDSHLTEEGAALFGYSNPNTKTRTKSVLLTQAEKKYFDSVFANGGDRADLLNQVPSAKLAGDELSMSPDDADGMYDYIEDTIRLNEGDRLPPSFYSGEFSKRYIPDNESLSATPDRIPQTETAAFKKWFRGSRVVNEDGSPKVVYHGTSEDFSTFKESTIGAAQEGKLFFGRGFYFADNERDADAYGSKTIPVYLKITNLLDTTDKDSFRAAFKNATPKGYTKTLGQLTKEYDDAAKKLKIEDVLVRSDGRPGFNEVQWKINGEWHAHMGVVSSLELSDDPTGFAFARARVLPKDPSSLRVNSFSLEEIKRAINDGGFDGVKGDGSIGHRGDEYVVFSPNQIKSATGNNGDFSESDDINLSIDTPEQTAANNLFSGKDFIDRFIQDKPKWNERIENFVYNWLNTNDPRKRIYASADKKTAKNDMVTVEELRGKRTADEIAETRRLVVEPMLKELAQAKLTVSDLEEYGHGLHASERNQRMREVRAKMTLDQFLSKMTDTEAEQWQQAMSDLRSKTVMDELEGKDTQQGYLRLIDEVIADIANREDKEAAKQKALDNREFTEEEIDRGTPEHLQEKIDNALDRIEASKKLADKWADESPRLSGMTDEEGQAIIDKWQKDPRFKAMQSAKTKLDRINRMGVEALHDSGELTDDEYNGIVTGYKHYVPLQRDGFLETTPTVGRITGPTGKPLKVAMGSLREVVNIVAHSVQNYEVAVNRKHKATAGHAFYQFVVDNPNSGLTIEKVAKQPTHDREGNVVMYPSLAEPKNGIYVKVQVEKTVRGEKKMVSEKKLIMFDVDERTEQGRTVRRLLDSIKGDGVQLGPVMSSLAKVNRYLAMVNTMLSPEFVPTNFVRDFEVAFVHLSDEGISGGKKGLRTRIMKDIFPAIKGIFKAEKGDDQTEMGKWYRDFAKEGAKIGWMQGYEKIEDLAKELEHTMKLYGEGHTLLKKLDAMKKLVERSNTAIENGVRLATYKNLVESGMSKQEAASIASKLTVDFTQHGKYGPALNSLYLFANAGIVGNYRMITAIGKSKQVQKIVGGIAVGGFALQLLALASGGDDDSGEPYVLGLADFTRERNMIFMIPGTKGKHISIPMPYGYNMFYNMGAEAANMLYMNMQGKKYDAGKAAMRLVTGFGNSFNPLASGTILQTLSPTIADPIVMAAENKNFMGRDLMPKQNPFGPEKPDSERYWKNVSATSKIVASMVNRMTGGDRFEGGLIDVSPETLDMLYDTATGSTGKFVSNVLHLPVRAATGELAVNNMPFVRRFAGAWDDRAISSRYYEAVKEGDIAKQRYDGAETPFERAKVVSSPEYKTYRKSKLTEKQLTNLRKSLKLAEARADKERTETIRKRITSIQMNFLNRMEN